MGELDRERHDLAKAERDIADGEDRVTRQMLLLDELRRDKHDTKDAEAILVTMQQTLRLFRDHRELILAEIDRLEAKGDR